MKQKLTALFIVSTFYLSSAQVGDLYFQLEKELMPINIKKGMENLEHHIGYGKPKYRKKYAQQLAIYASMYLQECDIAYNRAEEIVEKLEKKGYQDVADKISEIRRDIYDLQYKTKAIITYCQWMINKPKTHNVKTFKSIVKAFNRIITLRNELSKKRKYLNSAIAYL